MSRTTTWSSCGWRTTEAIGRAGGPAYGARCVLPHLHTAKESAQTLAIEPPPRECVHGKTLPMAQTRTIGLHQPIHGSLWLSQTQAALWWLGREAPTWPGAAFGLLCAWRALAGDRDLAKAIPSQSTARHSPHHGRRRSLAPPPPAHTLLFHVLPCSSACRRAAWLAACALVLLRLAAGRVDAKPYVHKGIKRVSIVFSCHLDVVRPRWRGSPLFLAAAWLLCWAPRGAVQPLCAPGRSPAPQRSAHR